MLKILLINPDPIGTLKAVGILFPPLGLLSLAAYMEREGHQVAVRDLAVRKKEEISFKEYDIIGISSDTTRHDRALRLAKKAKANGCTVVLGGPHPCFVDEEILSTGSVDFVVHGEGEATLAELAAILGKEGSFHSVKGISFLSNRETVRTPRRPPIEDLDTLPFPARHLVNMDDYRRTRFGGREITPVTTSRGCPSQCAFCSSSNFFGTKWRARTVESVLTELEEVQRRYHFNAVAFVDDTFNISPRRVIAISRGIVERKLDLWWWSLARSDLLLRNEEMVEEMVKAGAKSVFVGVESSDQKVLDSLRKGIDVDGTRKTVALLKRHGLQIHASYILGGLQDTPKTVHETIRFAKELDTDIAQFSILTPYPGTTIFDEVKDRIFRWRGPWSFFDMQHLVFRHDHFSFVRLEWLLLKAHLLYYTRSKKAVLDIWRNIKKHRLGMGTVFRFVKDHFWG